MCFYFQFLFKHFYGTLPVMYILSGKYKDLGMEYAF